MLVKARVRLLGVKDSYSSTVLIDSGARMSLLDKILAEKLGVEYTGREINFVSISGHAVRGLEAILPQINVEGEVLKYEPVVVAEIPKTVKEALRKSNLDENMIIGVLTLERANMIPDTTTGTLKKIESFIFSSFINYLSRENLVNILSAERGYQK
jgi:predicted aspartyl protease